MNCRLRNFRTEWAWAPVLALCASTVWGANPKTVRSSRLSVELTTAGIAAGTFKTPDGPTVRIPLQARTVLQGCDVTTTTQKRIPGGTEFTRQLACDHGLHTVTVVERMTPAATGIDWKIEIRGQGSD